MLYGPEIGAAEASALPPIREKQRLRPPHAADSSGQSRSPAGAGKSPGLHPQAKTVHQPPSTAGVRPRPPRHRHPHRDHHRRFPGIVATLPLGSAASEAEREAKAEVRIWLAADVVNNSRRSGAR